MSCLLHTTCLLHCATCVDVTCCTVNMLAGTEWLGLPASLSMCLICNALRPCPYQTHERSWMLCNFFILLQRVCVGAASFTCELRWSMWVFGLLHIIYTSRPCKLKCVWSVSPSLICRSSQCSHPVPQATSVSDASADRKAAGVAFLDKLEPHITNWIMQLTQC